MRSGARPAIAIVKAPRVLPRVIELPREVAPATTRFVLLSSIIHAHLRELFAGREVVGYSQFRVTRDADLWIDEEEVKNLRQALQGELPQRQFGLAVRLEVAADCPPPLAQLLLQQFELDGGRSLSLRRAGQPRAAVVAGRPGRHRPSSSIAPFVPGTAGAASRRSPTSSPRSAQHDILLHHPYQSFEPVVEFIRKRRRRPRRRRDQADGLSHRRQFGADGGADRRRAARQGSHRRRRADGALRRGGEHQLGGAAGARPARRSSTACSASRRTPSSRCCCAASATPRAARGCVPYAHLGTGNYHPRTTRAVHRLRPAHREPGSVRRRQRGVPAHHEPRHARTG